MKKFIVAGVALIAMSLPSFAADLPVKAPVAAPLPSWTGVYLGGNAGYAWGDTDWAYFNLPGQTISHNPTGFIAGIHGGAQYQWSQIVLGIEASYSGGYEIDDEGLDSPIFAAAFNSKVKIKDLLTVGGRLGWAFNAFNGNWLVYGTGGYAQSNIMSAFYVRSPGNTFANGSPGGELQSGWFWGFGVDYLLTSNLYVGLEYKHVDLDTGRHNLVPQVLTVGSTRFVDASFDAVQFRVGVKLP